MTGLDWFIVVIINGSIILWGLVLARGTQRSVDWFLAARGLPWWIVGLSMFATAVDSGDYVAVVGGAYNYGLTNLTTWWIGLPLGWFLVAYFVLIPLYRSGMFTNAEYLEYRFGPTARVLSALIQIQYRTNVLANISFSLYLTFRLLTGTSSATSWYIVVSIALGAALYTASGGLRSVAVTDAMQAIVMFVAAAILWTIVWNNVGGWSGLEARFTSIDPSLVDTMLHVGGQNNESVPAPLMILSWTLMLSAYVVVNHSQSMRMLASRSLVHLRWAALAASVITAFVMWFNISLGVLGRSVMPHLENPDEIFPRLALEYLGPGLIGIVVAGVLAGGISTYDSIGSALAAVFTRDIYARFFVTDREDKHYLQVSRLATVIVIAASFAYIPFVGEGMMAFYIRLTNVAVTPLFTIYLMGTLTRVHRDSGTFSLVVGILYGLLAFLGYDFRWDFPTWFIHPRWAYMWSLLITSGSMLLFTLIRGWEEKGAFEKRVPTGIEGDNNWLEKTRREAAALVPSEEFFRVERRAWYLSAWFWTCVFLAVVLIINLGILW
jgi:SSS family solute:Na+ symporter